MYHIKPEEMFNDQPWLKSYSQRVRSIYDAKKCGLKVVMYLYEAADTSTFRYRVYNMCQSLEVSLNWRGVYFYNNELENVKQYLDDVDLLVVARFRWCFELEEFIDLAKGKDIKVAFEIDDMVYNTKYIPIIVNTLSVGMSNQEDYNYWFAYTSRLKATALKCDAIITTNDFLAEKMHEDLNIDAYVLQNFINRQQEEISERYYQQKAGMYYGDKFVIGYFSGTPSHINDFMVVAPEIKKLLERYEDIVLRIVGFMEMPDSMIDLEERGRIERVPLVNFLELQKEIAEVDVNIAPLVNNEFSNCKSELKFFEAAIVGTITCATPSNTFKNSIQDGVTGYLCERGKWFQTLEQLYLNRKSNSSNIIKDAKKYCIDRYAYYNQTANIESVLNQISK